MPFAAYTFFETVIGQIGIAWAERGIVGVQLPERTPEAARARLDRRFPRAIEATPSAAVRAAIDGVVGLLSGEAVDLAFAALDFTAVVDFDRRVYTATRAILPGRTLTYGEIAGEIGDPGAARAVGNSLGKNPFPIIVPCHRVLGADGRAGGFSAHGGVETKMRILSIEKAGRGDAPALFDALPLAVKPRR